MKSRLLLVSSLLLAMALGAAHCAPVKAHADASEAVNVASSAVIVHTRAFPQVVGITAQGTPHGVLVAERPDGAACAQVNVSVLDARALPVAAVVALKNDQGQILNQYDPNVQTGCFPIDADVTQVEISNLTANTYRGQVTWGSR